MAATLEDSYNLSIDPTFRARVLAAIAIAAKDVYGELPADPPDADKDEKRAILALGVISNSQAYLDRFVLLVAVNPSVITASTDGDIQFTINSLWDDVAGV